MDNDTLLPIAATVRVKVSRVLEVPVTPVNEEPGKAVVAKGRLVLPGTNACVSFRCGIKNNQEVLRW
jgi:hypothetical protein